jgi:hypothetical protein
MPSTWATIKLAFRVFWRTFVDPEFPAKVEPLLARPIGHPALPAELPPTPKPSGEPLRLVALLQREGRLVDFLMEDIQAYPDTQIGAAVRDIHRQCRKVVQEHLELEPVMAQNEEEQVTIADGFDPSAVRLTGNVSGKPPFTGALKHRGWRVKEIKLPQKAEGQDEFILMPAEVELV